MYWLFSIPAILQKEKFFCKILVNVANKLGITNQNVLIMALKKTLDNSDSCDEPLNEHDSDIDNSFEVYSHSTGYHDIVEDIEDIEDIED